MTERPRTVSEDDLRRLKREREDADARYNEALTGLDRSIQAAPLLPSPPPSPDEAQVTPLNTRWDILANRPAIPGGWRGRVARFVWGMLEPVLNSQQAFNSALVDHINRNIGPQREVAKSIETTIAVLQQQVDGLLQFQSRLIVYLQQVTPYVDTKDYEFAAIARRINEDTQQELPRLDHLERLSRSLGAGLSGLSDEMLKRHESLLASVQRYTSSLESVRESLTVAQQQLSTLRRATAVAPASAREPAPASDGPSTGSGPSRATSRDGGTAPGGPEWYVGFEDLFRGSREEITARQESYLPLFAGASDVLDVGCGRGEFLDLLASRGISARGIDLNQEMVAVCRERGLDVAAIDALSYLRQQPDASLGGLIAMQVVEHLEPDYLLETLDQAHRTLRPGSVVVLETINAACWLAFFESFIRDLTHVKPLHPDTLKYVVTASGFADVEVRFAAPVAPANSLQPTPRVARVHGDEAMVAFADTFDGNMERLNRLMFTNMDYAIIARRP